MREPDERELELLRERARALASKRAHDESRSSVGTYASFERSGVRYAIDMRFVFGVARVLTPTPLPDTESHWLGMSSLHGELLPVVDVHPLLGGARASDGEETAASVLESEGELALLLVLVVGLARRELAIVIDAVVDARPLPRELALLRSDQAEGERLLLGTDADGTRVLIGEALLRDPRLFLQARQTGEP